MLDVVHTALALIFAWYARFALVRGVAFLRGGLGLLYARTESPQVVNPREDVHLQRAFSEAGAFVIGGALWVAFGVFAVGACLYFGGQVLGVL